MSEIQETLAPVPQTATPPAPEVQGEKPIDPALIEKLATARNLVNIDNLLQNSLFPGGAAGDIVLAQQFLKGLHAPIIKECQSHPDYVRATTKAPAQPAAPILPTEGDLKAMEKASEKRERKEAKANRQRSN